jgi:hypothetical protein
MSRDALSPLRTRYAPFPATKTIHHVLSAYRGFPQRVRLTSHAHIMLSWATPSGGLALSIFPELGLIKAILAYDREESTRGMFLMILKVNQLRLLTEIMAPKLLRT